MCIFCILEYWKEFFERTEIEDPDASKYVEIFLSCHVKPDTVTELNREYLTAMDITVVGDQMAILKYVKEVNNVYIP